MRAGTWINPFLEKAMKKAMKKGDEIDARIEKVLIAIANDPKITVNELTVATGTSRKQIEIALKRLKDAGKIHREGSARNGKWIIE